MTPYARYRRWLTEPLSVVDFNTSLFIGVVGLIGFTVFTGAAIEAAHGNWLAAVLAVLCLLLAGLNLARVACAYERLKEEKP